MRGDIFDWQITVPPNSSATLFVPARDVPSITESGRPATSFSGGRFVKYDDGCAVFEVESGHYHFLSQRAIFPEQLHQPKKHYDQN